MFEMTEKEFEDCEQLEQQKHDEKIRELEEKIISLSEYAEKSGNEWVLEEPETYYRYKYEEMTYAEWTELFG